MKSGSYSDIIHKDVVIIGNGPSGLALSYMLSGNIPYLISNSHPDELLSARLGTVKDCSLIRGDLEYLASGLEGRSTNPISLLLDSLVQPCADIGLELDSLIEWRKDGIEIDHVVLGKGPPGGSWHKMDPNVLTLSLGSWMALPGLPYKARDGLEKRASAKNVAQYYLEYSSEMNLEKFCQNGVCVTKVKQLKGSSPRQRVYASRNDRVKEEWVKRVENDFGDRTILCTSPEENVDTLQRRRKVCSLSNAFNFIRLRSNRKCKRPRDCCSKNDLSPDRKIREVLSHSREQDAKNGYSQSFCKNSSLTLIPKREETCKDCGFCKRRSISLTCDLENFEPSCDSVCSKSFNEQVSFLDSFKKAYNFNYNSSTKVPDTLNQSCDNGNDFDCLLRLKEQKLCDPNPLLVSNSRCYGPYKWLIETYDTTTGKNVTYFCKHLVLANGANDLPNRLAISDNDRHDPSWLLHDVRSLEMELDLHLSLNPQPDPVLVIGAGLSAADAIMTIRCRNIPVLHVFRNKYKDLNKQLPENMYPEYHKVHQMMQDGGSSYSLYQAFPECEPIEFDETKRTVTLRTKLGEELKYHISFAAILIGARPDLDFLPQHFNLGIDKNAPVDNKKNNIDVNKLTHSVNGFDGLYAMGPLTGDNFVRFIPGGALAIVSDLYRQYGF